MLEKYYHVLGLEEGANFAEVKEAYRKQAKMLHPDLNKSASAQEDFVFLNEAYEFFLNQNARKRAKAQKDGWSSHFKQEADSEEWQAEIERARERAAQFAKMPYEDFVESSFYKTTGSLMVIADFLNISTAFFLVFGGPSIGYLLKGTYGLVGGLVLVFITTPFWAKILIHKQARIDFLELGKAILQVLGSKVLWVSLAYLLNFFLIVRIGFRTLIPLWWLFALLAGLIAGIYGLERLLKKYNLRAWFWGPAILNTFLLLNFSLSSHPVVENYAFMRGEQNLKNGRQKTTFIYLEGDQYAQYWGPRLFFDYKAMEGADLISYTIEEGLFGLRVVKQSEFKKAD
ncbi:J domain-containing protein [Croceimicrobium hydrocarbonivorans]|uniref:DnaJ domain-containing protein n=1 Tax=Croceimicrobium hydrocarbonivorans TaxID=2761580 RepID=A0A7H0VIB6_9FLAO|nr:J domain-containing protein [Croceimicrobium hydrocarbonivorans]QNR25464.1 DnaJ domain-containing protein [Croceimicrobium hydrocarbonivorans]